MTSSQTNMHVEVSVKLNERFDFFPAELRDRIETASSDALSNTSNGPQTSTRVVWIVQDTYRITPDVTNPGMLEYTYNEGHVKFSQNVVGVYEALEKANVAALSQFLDLSALAENEGERGQDEEDMTVETDPNDLDDYEDDDENLGEDETDEQIPLRVKNRLRFVRIADMNNIKLGYGDVG